MASLTPEQKNAEMTAERSVLAQLFAASLDDFDGLDSTVFEYHRRHPEIAPSEVLAQFKDANHRTALHFACRGTVLEKILNAPWLDGPTKASLLRAKDRDGMTPLMLAAQVSDRHLAERNVLLLLDKAGDGSKLGLARSHAGATALHYSSGAAGTGRCIRALVSNAPVALRSPSKQGGMPLHWACAVPPGPRITDACDTIEALLDCGADVNATAQDPASSSNVPPPLFVCLAAGQEKHANLILDLVSSSSATSSLLPTLEYELPGTINIFHMAADLNMVGFLGNLLEYCASLESSNSSNNSTTSNSYNDNNGSLSLLGRLLSRKNGQGLTPLEVAATEGHIGCAYLLLPPGPDRTEERAAALVREFGGKNHPTMAVTGPSSGATSLDGGSSDIDDNPAGTGPPSSPSNKPGLPPKPDAGTSGGDAEPDPVEQQAREEATRLLLSEQQSPDNDATMRKQAEQFRAEGNALFAKKEYERACERYGEAIACDPREASYYSNRSACHLLLCRPEPALRDAAFAHALRPDWPKAAYRLSAARFALKRYEDAAVAAWEGLALDPENDELRSLLRKCVKKGRQEHLHQQSGGTGERS
jgi:tetratricopeptide (TPR) repeat protein